MSQTSFIKGTSLTCFDRSYKIFNLDAFNDTLNMELHNIGNNNSYGLAFLTVANIQIPIFCILSLIETLFLRSGIKDEIEMKEG